MLFIDRVNFLWVNMSRLTESLVSKAALRRNMGFAASSKGGFVS